MEIVMKAQIYNDKSESYYSHVRMDAVMIFNKYFTNSDVRLLDVGCGTCDTLVYLKETKSISVAHGIEMYENKQSNQSNSLVDLLSIGYVEEKVDDFSTNYYDCILCLDVLEHLVDPWSVIKSLKDKLKKGGLLIISCPNIREFKTIYEIFLKGTFRYRSEGIMDQTHLRFFCPQDLRVLIESQGLNFIDLVPNYKMAPNRKKISKFVLSWFEEILAPQYFVIAEK